MNAPLRPMRDPELRPYLNSVNAWHGYVRFLGLPTLQDHPDTPMWELFVQPLLSERAVSPDTPPNEWPPGQSVLAALHEARRLVVLGDPGSGKSTLVNWLAWLLVAGLPDRVPEWMQNMIPLPLILRELDLSGVETFDSLLGAFLKRPVAEHLRGKQDRLRELLAAGRVLVLADGLDEVAEGQRQGLRRALWEGFNQYPESRFIATSRVVGYEDYRIDFSFLKRPVFDLDEIKMKLEGHLLETDRLIANVNQDVDQLEKQEKELLSDAVNRTDRLKKAVPNLWATLEELKKILFRSELFYILPFDDDRIHAFAHNWYRLRSLKQTADSDTADFIAALFRDETTKRLARTPQILTLMALVFRVRAQLPDGRALLYDLITEAYLDSLDKSRKLMPAQDPYPWREKRRWLARVGFEMQYRRTNPLPQAEDGGEPSEKGEAGGEKDSASPTAAPLTVPVNSEGVKSPLNSPHPNPLPEGEGARDRELLASREEVRTWIAAAMRASGYPADEAFVDAYLDWVARRSGLLLPRGEGRYAFVHLSFQEYAAALYLVEHLTDADWVLAQRAAETYPDGDPRVTAAALREWAKDPRWQETLVFCFESFAHQPKDARRMVGWLFGESYGDFLERLKPSKSRIERSPEADRAALLARILTDPHTGLNPVERETGFDAFWRYLGSERRFNYFGWSADPNVLNLLLSAPFWTERFWQRVAETEPEVLNLHQANRLDLQSLSTLAGLKNLDLSETPFADLSPLAGLHQLQFLNFSGTEVTDLTPLAGMHKLRLLYCRRTGSTDLTPLAGLHQLRILDFSGTAVTGLTPLAGLHGLQSLDFSNTAVADLTPLADLHKLQSLDFSNTAVADLTPLADLHKLQSLDFSNTAVADLTPLADLHKLQSLDFSNTAVADLTPLADLRELQFLYFNRTVVTDLSSLAGLPRLQHLFLGDTPVTDLSPLIPLGNLLVLEISGVKAPIPEALRKRPGLRIFGP